jgi:hypothetical protein
MGGRTVMTDTAEDCRVHAGRCIEWANNAATAAERHTFYEMAKAWLKLAETLEKPSQSFAAAPASSLPKRAI